ncbi:MAG TPA: host attachment protein [Gammaproteobacteria bacterium]|nr:host attachment protein [Gammaproteobacteria bacterium]
MHSNEITWVIVLNSNICRIFKYSKKDHQLEAVKELNHPENKLRDIDLTSDRPGHYKSSNSAHGSYSQPSDPKEIKINNFVREVANMLDRDRNIQAYNKLIIIAADHINGLLYKHINKHVQKLISKNIEKDLIHQSNHDLLNTLSNFY